MLKAEQIPVEVMNEFHNALAHDESCAEAIAAAIRALAAPRGALVPKENS